MATTPKPSTPRRREVDYPTSDGRPLGETDLHRQDIFDVIAVLQARYADRPDVYVTGDLLLFDEEGNRRKHIAPDVFVAFGVPKLPPRDHYLLWKEGKSPDVVIEITSKTTRSEDQDKKFLLYRDLLQVPEYFQFDPTEDYLHPSLQGHRLLDGQYLPIAPVDNRLPSEILDLHLERNGHELRLFDPATRQRLLTDREAHHASRLREAEAQRQAAEAEQRAAQALQRAADAQQQAAEAHQRLAAIEAKNESLLRELEALRRRSAPPDA